jgi:hypothetical protein
MNMNQIINMIIRLIMRKGINAGINKGVGMVSSRGKSKTNRALPSEEDAEFQEFKRKKQLERKAAASVKRSNDPIDRM